MAQAYTKPDRGQRGRVARDKAFWLDRTNASGGKGSQMNNDIATAKTREEFVTRKGYYMKQGSLPLNQRGK